MTMRFDILTLFPNFFSGPLDHGILSRAIASGARPGRHPRPPRLHPRPPSHRGRPSLRRRRRHGPQAAAHLRVRRIAGCRGQFRAQRINSNSNNNLVDNSESDSDGLLTVIAPQVHPRPHPPVRHPALRAGQALHPGHRAPPRHAHRVVLICGRYEGVDERVADLLADEELSIGDYVLSGGELAAAVVLDATVRLLPGVLGHADSARFESFGLADADLAGDSDCHPERSAQPGSPASLLAGVEQRAVEGPASAKSPGVPRSTHGAGGILDYPQYTRPADFRGAPIPEVSRRRRPRRHPPLAPSGRPRQDPPQPPRPPRPRPPHPRRPRLPRHPWLLSRRIDAAIALVLQCPKM